MKTATTLKICSALAVVCALAARHPAQAQWNPTDAFMSHNSYSSGWVNPYNNTMTDIYQSNINLITTQAIERSQLFNYAVISMGTGPGGAGSARARRLKQISSQEKAAAARFIKYQGTMYKEAGESQAPTKVAELLGKNLGVKPSEVKPVLKALLDVYRQRAKQQGAPPNDVARTLAYCVSANYYYFSGGTGVPETQVAAVRSKMRTALSEDKTFRAMSDVQKRQTAESMIILTHLVGLGIEEVAPKVPAEKREQVKAGYRQLAGINLQGILGVDPKRVAFDKMGLVIKPA